MAKKKRGRPAKKQTEILSKETKKGILIIVIFLIALLSLLSLLSLAGSFGVVTDRLLGIILGWGKWLFPLLMLVWGFILLNPDKYLLKPSNYIGLLLTIIAGAGLLELINNFKNTNSSFVANQGGGYIGFAINQPLQQIMGGFATLVILLGLFIIFILISFNISLDDLGNKINIFRLLWLRLKTLKSKRIRDGYEEDYEEYEEEIEEEEEIVDNRNNTNEDISKDLIEETINDPTDLIKPERPKKHRTKVNVPIDLLEANGSKPTSGDVNARSETIRRTFANFGIEVEMGEINIGPTVTQFTFKPAEGVKLSQITNLNNDIALALAAHPIRIEAPIPGKSLVGIEVPNQKVAVVKIREIIESESYKNNPSSLAVALGKNVAGECQTTDIAKMPHCMIAGATGSGKSVCINNFIISLLYRNNPEELKMIMVDPKRVELSIYNGIPHLLTPVINDVQPTINALRWAVNEMDERYKLLSAVHKRDIKSYNSSVLVNQLPYIIIIIDELADLMAVAPREVEAAIIRLAQIARAVGIHLIIATQRPSTNVITGLIKANITTRIAFSMASQIDSRTIIDSSGAEKLLGNGDMLYTSAEISKPRRLQGALVTEKEIKRIVQFWKEQSEPEYNEAIVERQKVATLPSSAMFDDNDDELLPEAHEIVMKAGKASASLLQRRLRVGYARAARLLDLLEERGIVGPSEGAKPREILVRQDDLEENLDMREYEDGWEDEKDNNKNNNNKKSANNEEDDLNN